MRDRLIELLNGKSIDTKADVECVADYLLANGVIVPPCQIGTKVYVPIESLTLPIPRAVYECKIQRYVLATGGLVPIVKFKKGAVTYGDVVTSLDKLYPTIEEAEKALERGERG